MISPRLRFAAAAAASLLATAAAGPARAQSSEGELPAFFEVLPRMDAIGRTLPRSAGEGVDPALVVRMRPEALAAAPGGRLRLDLGPGVSAVAEVKNVHTTLLGRRVVAGKLAGRPRGRFLLVADADGREAAATIDLSAEAADHYVLGRAPGGSAELVVRRTAAPPAGTADDALRPPSPSATTLPRLAATNPRPRADDPAGPPDAPTQFDLLIAYTPAAAAQAGGPQAAEVRAELAMEGCNQAYAASGIATRARLVHVLALPYTDGNTYRDVMAYAPGIQEFLFSSPAVTFAGGVAGNAAQADNTRSINENAPVFCNFRRATVNAQPLVSISAPGPEAIKESGQPARLLVTRAGTDLGQPLTVALGAVADKVRNPNTLNTDPVVAGVDYQPLPATVTIPAGQATAELDVVPLAGNPAGDGRFFDTPRVLAVVLRAGEGYSLGLPAVALARIYDQAAGVTIAAGAPARATQDPPQAAEIKVSRTGPADRALSFSVIVTGAAYRNGDAIVDPPTETPTGGAPLLGVFNLAAGVPSFSFRVSARAGAILPAAGEALEARPMYPNAHYDADEVARVTLLAAAPTPPPAVVSLSANGTRATEGAAPVTLKFTRAGGDLGADLTVAYRLSGSAAGGPRLALLPGTVVIPAGASKAKIKVRALDDGVPEPDQTVKIKLVAGAGYTVASPAKVSVVVPDPAP